MRILILGGGLQGLACGSSLHKEHEVGIVTSNLMCRHSRFFKWVYSDVKANDESLYDLLRETHFDVLIPVSDLTVPFLSKNKATIEEVFGVRCAVPDYNQVYLVENKNRFMQFCQEQGIPHPKTSAITEESLNSCASLVGFPSLIKPDYSVGARGITRVDSLKELKEKYSIVSKSFGPCTLQELVENEDYYFNVMLYRNKEGKILAHAILKIVRMYPVHGGSSSCCISVENNDLLDICIDCLDKLGWVGMADFDVLQNLDNGAFQIIEINPRVPASLRAAVVSGVDFPVIIVKDAVGDVPPVFEYHPGKVLRYLGTDIIWRLKCSRRFQTRPNWLHFFGKNVFYQDIYRNDPSTWWTWLIEGLSKIVNKKNHNYVRSNVN